MNRRITPPNIQELKENEVFVFGSNSTGFHGAGASGFAFRDNSDMKWREDSFFLKAMNSPVGSDSRIGKWAVYGVSRGLQKGHKGCSYAIETIVRPGLKRSTPLKVIESQIIDLCEFAEVNKHLTFLITAIGCNLAGYTVSEIKSIFRSLKKIPDNFVLPREFEFRDIQSENISTGDGIDHINIYSRGQTNLGRLLSNFSHTPFKCEDGEFESIEGYWYWLKLSIHPERDHLRRLHGFEAKKIGEEMCDGIGEFANSYVEGFNDKIRRAIEIKIETYPHIRNLLKESVLPFDHYYMYSDRKVDAGFKWIVEHIELIRKRLK